jgi:uncharacterized protein (TIGR00269 family)
MKCSECGKKAVFFRRYEGRHLCPGCFVRSVDKKARKTIRYGKMLGHGDRIAVAVSGGKDSTALLHILHKILGRWKDSEMFAITIDEGIRGYRPPNLRRARQACRELGIKHYVFSFRDELGKTLDRKVKEIKPSDQIREPCTYCGVGRRWILNRKARELGATKLAVGHNLDDEVQSVLLNYMRGDLPRASRMGPVTDWSRRKRLGERFVPRIKPLREVPEKEIALYVLLKGYDIKWDECPYAGGVRFDARDFINSMEDKYPGIKYTMLYTFDKINPCVREVSKREEGELVLCSKCSEPGSKKVCKTCELWR